MSKKKFLTFFSSVSELRWAHSTSGWIGIVSWVVGCGNGCNESYILRVPESSRKLEKNGKGKLSLGQAHSLFKRVIRALHPPQTYWQSITMWLVLGYASRNIMI